VSDLLWEGCVNVRDLGGNPTEDGGETRYGAVVRADSIRRLSPAGWEALAAYGVRRVVDLRHHAELAADPLSETDLDVVHIPVLAEPDHPDWVELDAVAARSGCLAPVYLEFLERYPARFAAAVQAVARGPAVVVVHCQGGKDRTGLVTALLLRLAGASREAVAADYALSEANLREFQAPWIGAAPDEAERARRLLFSLTPAATMLDVLEELERRHGGAREYLLAAGATPEDLDGARALLRG
jgi:protein-tyrosine phosphatase